MCRAPAVCELREKISMPRSSSAPLSSWATADMYTAWASPSGTRESKIAMLTSGRTLRLRQWRASGEETQSSSV